MQTVRLALVGFGNVGRAFVRLLERKRALLASQYGLDWVVTGIATGRHGMAIDPQGLDVQEALRLAESGQSLDVLCRGPRPASMLEFIRACPADVLFENSPVNHHTGQPAIDHLRTALECGMHAITANKGPVVHGHALLTETAVHHGRKFMFESTVMDGAPIFSLFRQPLPASELVGFMGILNSCTNLMLEMMEQGRELDEVIRYAQSIGIAETDPSADVDGWDAAIKVAALITVLMGEPFTPQQVVREGIRGLSAEDIRAALDAGERWKLVCTARRENGQIRAQVAPQRVPSTSPLYSVGGTSSFVQFEMDTLSGLGILESNPGPETTAYGLLADLLNALGKTNG